MNAHLVVGYVRSAGSSLREIADRHGCHKSLVSHVVHGRRSSPELEKAISDKTGIPLHLLWPSRYVGLAADVEMSPCHLGDLHDTDDGGGQQ